MFNFRYEMVGQNKDIVAVVLTGILDENNAEYVFSCIQDEIQEGHKKLILDCGELVFISSMGLGMLVRVNARMKKLGGDVKIAAVQSAVLEVLSVVGLTRMFEIYGTVGEAIEAHGG